jgi:hypothetical protein
MNQIELITHDVNAIRQDLKNHQVITSSELTELKDSVNKLVMLIEGHPLDKERGLVHRIHIIEDFTKSVHNTKMYLLGNIAAAVFIISFLGAVIIFILNIYNFFSGKK